ncbi:titin isoform X2 [Plutella xylostella]|uniref:titin isoform X2 n=1 Tax=Plutella xylostella TaxID=51655 RepID=UPI0020325E18|nr:titin isoform X2 [Plutella xylostella]
MKFLFTLLLPWLVVSTAVARRIPSPYERYEGDKAQVTRWGYQQHHNNGGSYKYEMQTKVESPKEEMKPKKEEMMYEERPKEESKPKSEEMEKKSEMKHVEPKEENKPISEGYYMYEGEKKYEGKHEHESHKYEEPKYEPIYRKVEVTGHEDKYDEKKESHGLKYVKYEKYEPLILGRFGLGFDKRTASSTGLQQPLTVDYELVVVGRDYWGRCRSVYKDPAGDYIFCVPVRQ